MKRLVSAVSIVSLAALASGCALQPAYERPADAAPAAWPAGPAYAVPDAPGTTPAADTGWQDFLADARLRQLVGIALANNQDLQVALLRVSQARTALQLQRSAALPQVGVEASGTRGRSAGGATTRSNFAGLAASWEIDLFGRLQSLTDAAREQYLASAHGRQAAHILLVAQVAEQYLAMLAYGEQLAVTDETLAAARESYRIVKLQFDTGTVSELDETLARGNVEQAAANHAAQQRLRAQAENALVLLLGQPLPPATAPDTPLDRQPILAAQFPAIPAGLPSELLLRRPDVQQAEALLRAEYANIGAARAAFFPNIGLTASAGTASAALGQLFEAGTGVWSFAPSVLLPLFDGGARQASLDSARIARDIAVAQYRRTVQAAFREVADGLAARGTYDTELAARQRDVAAQQRRLELAELLYSSGTGDYLGVLTAKTDLYNARVSLIAARQNQLAALVGLYRALGGGWLENSGDTPAQADNGVAVPAS
ncbi:efflux transporter outer membrane subunit [Pseudoduganella umbonata]|uniref:Efflux transporter outer membrane subunit n=1 Tax=Pseudoduganella umbonata TaxID=864828 RepID=A0A4P8HL01_9BURK|nr:efflux transporter outer membrane subunit [Pseudoduganella umbonata]MBB3221113.1 multidrug efflux system outer membrane protein [Pseudoduganella umbonata]QCP10307.1 efflux transporter outer membrane subunit [Pseudoduganella umbonata]